MSENLTQTAEPIKLVIVDQSKDATDAARDSADARLDQELGEGSGFRRFIKGIWKGNIAKDFYRQRYTNQALTNIESAQDTLVYEAPAQARARALEATIERYQGEYGELIHTEAGERREVQADDSELATSMKDLIRRYTNGELNDATLPEERTRLLGAYRETHGTDDIGQGIVTVDNLLAVTQAVAGAIEHGESLDHVLENMQVITGEVRTGVRTEAHYTRIDKVIDKLSKTRVGALVGPETVATVTTIAASLARVGSHSVVGAVTKTILPGIAAGGWAALRENRRTKDERSQHSREMAQGKEFSEGDKRRVEMEKTRYETLSAIELTDHLHTVGSQEAFETGGNDALQAALDGLAAIEVRVHMSDRQGIDLISYSDPAAIGDERMALDVARAEVKVALNARLTEDTRRALGLDEIAGLDDILNTRSEEYQNYIEDYEIQSKDAAFRKLKARRVAKAAAIGVAVGVAGGLIAQEAIAAVDPTRAGLLEQLWGAKTIASSDGLHHQTVLEGLVAGDHTTIHTGPSSEYTSHSLAAHDEMRVSNDAHVIDNHNGTIDFVDPNGHHTVDNLSVNKDGSLPADSLKELHKLGMTVEDKSFDKQIVTTETQNVGIDQYVNNHIADTTQVKRDLWYDNNTPRVFDKNELGLHWHGNGVEANGTVQMSVATMTPNGSYDGSQSVEWQEAARSGNLALAISASVGTQTHVFMVPIGVDGIGTIPANNPASHFFTIENGHPVFKGAYAEVVQKTGTTDGVTHIRPLATFVGNRSDTTIADQVQVSTTEHHVVYDITTNGYDTIQNNFTEMAPDTPIQSRRSLEAVNVRHEEGYYYRGEEYLSPAEIRVRREETSPRLLENKEYDLNPQEELAWYRDLLQRKRGKERVEKIDSIIDSTPELSSMGGDLKAIIALPVIATGELESKNIYNVISRAYASQDSDSLAQTAIIINANWFDDDVDNPDKKANIDRTLAEIKRAKEDFPSVKIASFESVYDRAEAVRTGGVIGYVARDLYDTALLSLDRAMKEGRLAGDRDVLIIRNDADPKGVSTHYLKRFIEDVDKYPETDVFTGTLTYDTERAKDLPGFLYVTNFMQSLNTIAAIRDNTVHFAGPNAGIKAASLAAAGSMGFDEYSGAGSDDVFMGRRIESARKGSIESTSSGIRGYYNTLKNKVSRGERTSTPNRKIGRRVAGARVESDSDRLEEKYRQGKPIIATWNDGAFDGKSGYVDRSAGVKSLGATSKENLSKNSDEVIDHIIADMSETIDQSSPSESVIRTALAFAFSGLKDQPLASAYTLIRRPNGKYALKVSKKGREIILNHLTRDNKGRFESYVGRKRRQLYGEASSRAKRRPTHRSLNRV